MDWQGRSVLLITYNWPPDLSVGSVRPVHLARGLARNGWRPIVLTVDERYYELKHSETTNSPSDITVIRTRRFLSPREIYAFLKKVLRPLQGEVPIVHENVVAGNSSGSNRWLARLKRSIVSLVNIPDEYVGWIPFAVWGGVRAVRKYKINCVVSTAPFFTAHLVAGMVSMFAQVPWVAEFRDPWSSNVHKSLGGRSGLSEYLARWLEQRVVHAAERVVCVTSVMTEAYCALYPDEPLCKWATITNGFDKEEFKAMGSVRANRRFTITYLGSFNYFRRPHLLLQSVADLLREGAIKKDDVLIKFIGECRYADGQSVAELAEGLGLEGICEIVDLLPRPEVFREMMEAYVLLLLANEQPLQIPGKTFEYMGAGRRVLTITESTSATAEVVRYTGIGEVVAPGDLSAMKQVLRQWYGEYCSGSIREREPSRGNAGRIMEYEWEVLAARYAALLATSAIEGQDRHREIAQRSKGGVMRM